MRIELYESGAGHLWLHPVGKRVLVCMDWEASFRMDAMTYGREWTEDDCPDHCAPFRKRGLNLIAVYENGKLDVSMVDGASPEALLYIGSQEHEPQKATA